MRLEICLEMFRLEGEDCMACVPGAYKSTISCVDGCTSCGDYANTEDIIGQYSLAEVHFE